MQITRFRGELIYKIFDIIGPPRLNNDNPAPCTEQGGRGLSPRPPVVSIILEHMGMVLDCPCLALEAQLIQKSGKEANNEIW